MLILLIVLLSVSTMSPVYSMQGTTQNSLKSEANQKIKIFATELKSALVAAIQKDGLHTAVQVCEKQAPKIAESLSTEGWKVARTSLRTRNENNKADEWETQVMLSFDEQYKAGVNVNMLSASKLNEDEFRLMKAIPTGQVCLACHGRSVEPKLLMSINERYPNDTALGFTLEDIRGAFTVTKIIDK